LRNSHDQYAPYWAIALVVLLVTGLSTLWLPASGFWSSYVLDMVGPAWAYILFRGLFTAQADNRWTRFFTPTTTLVSLLVAAYGIEALQYFAVYDATFDPADLVAYVALLGPMYVIDRWLTRRAD
jgi:hypothetical protein